MVVQIDEPGYDDQAARIEHPRAVQGRLRDSGDTLAAYADISHGVEAALRIDDASAADDEVETLLGGMNRGAESHQDKGQARGSCE
jgi:hypothetical protein